MAPALPPRPLLGDIRHRKIQHFEEPVIRREHRLGFHHFSTLLIESFDGISGFDQPSKLLQGPEIGIEIRSPCLRIEGMTSWAIHRLNCLALSNLLDNTNESKPDSLISAVFVILTGFPFWNLVLQTLQTAYLHHPHPSKQLCWHCRSQAHWQRPYPQTTVHPLA